MKSYRKILACIAAMSIMTSLTACGKKNNNEQGAVSEGQNGQTAAKNVTVRFLNFKPEAAPVYEEIARAYKDETGNTLIVETAANNTYEQTLSAKMSTPEAPVIFQINGPRGYANWRDYCLDMTDSDIYNHLIDKSAAVSANGMAYGIPYAVEGYGIIYNDEIIQRYFALENRATDFVSMDEVNSYEKLKALVEDMQANADALGIKGVFAATSLKSGDDWRWTTHLANIPIHREFAENNIDLTGEGVKTLNFAYGENYRNIFDLYLNNSTLDRKMLGSKITDESMAEFALGECAMVQNGSWAWSQISTVPGNTVSEENIRMMPIYMGLEGEENQGLCIGTENFLCINSAAKPEEQQAAKDFLFWLYSSETGKDMVVNKLGFIAPFDTFTDTEKPTDPLSREVLRWMDKSDVQTIPWSFTVFPSQNFKDDFGAALLQYAQGSRDWNYVTETVRSSWENESSML
ncbi:MAG: ABC transporter substrate-binding protein [Oscillospiraceae bacterium]|nr:ABC transporter substrate-binding protein [Oscillospiraceae bacterium]